MPAEEILRSFRPLHGSPNPPEPMPLSPPVTVTSFTLIDADTRFQGDDDIYDNISLRYRKALYGVDYGIPWTYLRGEERDQKMDLALAAGDYPESVPGVGLSIFVRGRRWPRATYCRPASPTLP